MRVLAAQEAVVLVDLVLERRGQLTQVVVAVEVVLAVRAAQVDQV
jgi:hypothetical protein